jgi:hypothetical protein
MRRSLTGFIVIAAASLALAATWARSEEELREPDNKGSVLYFSLAPDLRYADTTSYRGLSLNPRPEEATVTTGTGPRPQIAYLLAAFPPEGRPELSVVTFGMRYSKNVHLVRWGISPPCLQLASRDWPASGEGLMFGLTDGPDTSSVVELAWFVFQASSPGLVEIIPHPEPQNAIRVIASNPPVPVPVAGVGSLGFGMPGRAPAFSYPGPTLAAACSYGSICIMLTREEAAYYGEKVIYLGDGTDCIQGALCRGPMLTGACCMPDGICRSTTNKDCARSGGTYRGNYSLCDTVRCLVPEPTPGERKGP